MTKRNLLAFLAAILIVGISYPIISTLGGFSFLLQLPIATAVIFYFMQTDVWKKFAITVSIIVFRDIIIRFFAIGLNDTLGTGYLSLFLLIELFLTLLPVLIISALKKELKREWLISFIICLVFLLSYIMVSFKLKINEDYFVSESFTEAKRTGALEYNVSFTDTVVFDNGVRVRFKEAWVEKKIDTLIIFDNRYEMHTQNKIIIKSELFPQYNRYLDYLNPEKDSWNTFSSHVEINIGKNLDTLHLTFQVKDNKNIKTIVATFEEAE